jgi:enamine deaminase RidA (YjgF/YER057c/UK114 family)
MKNSIRVFAIIFLFSTPILAQDFEGFSNSIEVTLKEDKIEESKGKYFALLMGVNEYADPSVNDLDEPIKDVDSFYNIISEKYSFERQDIRVLKNPTREDMIVALDELSQVVTKNDNLLIFYAGHGHFNNQTNQGYWLPADAQEGNTANWFRNSTLVDYIGAIPAKHTLLISDACFSGSIFKTRKAFNNASMAYYKLNQLPSRKGMTSGTLNEVPDKSVFMKYLLKRLEDNTNKYVSSEELFSSFRIAVMNNSQNIPLFGEIQNVGDEGGDFIFVQRD